VYHESDDSFYIGIGRSSSERLLYIHAGVVWCGGAGGHEGGEMLLLLLLYCHLFACHAAMLPCCHAAMLPCRHAAMLPCCHAHFPIPCLQAPR
jgi:hypothetical protein